MILDMLNQVLGGSTVSAMSKQLNEPQQNVDSAISAAIPLLLGALTRNASSPQGAESLLSALDRDHDGSVLDDIGDFIGQGSGAGGGILGHLLGGRRGAIEQKIGQSSGLSAQSVSQLLTLLAPIIMGALGKVQRSQSLDANSLPSVLGGEMNRVRKTSSSDLGLLSLLDLDGDGNVVDDVSGLMGKLFGDQS